MINRTDRIVIVSGGAQGFGRGIVETLPTAGASVVIADHDQEAGEEHRKVVRTDAYY